MTVTISRNNDRYYRHCANGHRIEITWAYKWAMRNVIRMLDCPVFVIPEASQGYWQCNNCGHIELREREILCWKCGQGEMIFIPAQLN